MGKPFQHHPVTKQLARHIVLAYPPPKEKGHKSPSDLLCLNRFFSQIGFKLFHIFLGQLYASNFRLYGCFCHFNFFCHLYHPKVILQPCSGQLPLNQPELRCAIFLLGLQQIQLAFCLTEQSHSYS